MEIKNKDGKIVDINNLNFLELSKLETEIKTKMVEKLPFIKVLRELKALETEICKIYDLNKKIKESDYTHSELQKLGFDVVVHSIDCDYVGIVNYEKKKNDEYYKLTYFYKTNELVNNKDNPVSEDDIAKIKAILEIEGEI